MSAPVNALETPRLGAHNDEILGELSAAGG